MNIKQRNIKQSTNSKVVIISKNIHPKSKPRANRATELAKEFGKQGYDVSLYAVLGKYNYNEFEKKYNVKVRNLGKMLFATSDSDDNSRNTLIDKVLRKLFRKTLDFPDIELSFKTVKILKKEKDADLLITIGKPFTIHWGAAWAKKKYNKSFPKLWIADCGDPYMGSQFSTRPFYFKYVEKWFCNLADYLTIPVQGAMNGYYKEFHHRIKVIPQGFNFDEIEIPEKIENKLPTFIYAGTFFPNGRDPKNLLNYLKTINRPFKFIIHTDSLKYVTPHLRELGDKIELYGFIPREKLLPKMAQADFLINFDNGTKVQSPSKLIDYAIAKRPVLNIFDNDEQPKELRSFINGDYSSQLEIKNIEQYRIENVVNRFLNIISI